MQEQKKIREEKNRSKKILNSTLQIILMQVKARKEPNRAF